jgi:succinate dehydrogenase/fumarate reductase-like Fe-S protein
MTFTQAIEPVDGLIGDLYKDKNGIAKTTSQQQFIYPQEPTVSHQQRDDAASQGREVTCGQCPEPCPDYDNRRRPAGYQDPKRESGMHGIEGGKPQSDHGCPE